MDDNLISQFLDTPADADYGESDIIKMRKVHRTIAPCSTSYRASKPLLITQYRSYFLDDTLPRAASNIACINCRALQAFVNEKAAPEVLDYKGDLVARLQDQIQNQASLQGSFDYVHLRGFLIAF